MKGSRILFNILLVLIITGGVIMTKGSLQILASLLGQHDRKYAHRTVTQDFISYLFFFLIAVPDTFKLLKCVVQFMFGKRDFPDSKLSVFVVLVREGTHLFGLGCLLFKVMPYLDPLQTCLIIISAALLPSVIDIKKSFDRTRPITFLSILSCLFIFTALSVTIYTIRVSDIDTTSQRIPSMVEIIIWAFISIVMLSIRWIEVYVELEDRLKVKDEKVIVHGCSSFLRIVSLIVLFPTLYCNGIRGLSQTYDAFSTLSNDLEHLALNCSELSKLDINNTNRTDNGTFFCNEEETSYWLVVGSFLVHNVGAYLTTYFGVLACRLRMQPYGFAPSLIIATPLYVTLLINGNNVSFASELLLLNTDYKWLLVVFCFIGWAGQSFVCRHVFKNSLGRIELASRLFALPHYCSAMVDLALLHSRRLPENESSNAAQNTQCKNTVFICATMWHETRLEMKKLVLSILGLYDHPCDFEYEVHIIFDDAMETDAKKGKRIENGYVTRFKDILTEELEKRIDRNIDTPYESNIPDGIETPYGMRITLSRNMNCQNEINERFVVHLKDSNKILSKKRWSQIMYMFYFVGYYIPLRESAENTFILTLDGDVDFKPKAVEILLDRMKLDLNVGATCGRIKPGGFGPVVWYQRFEYALGHWLQKSAEHMFGCVLCSPGCFSLFRVKALMDDNVMRIYATLPTEARHFLQYDQGEDRWLSTLLLKQGYKIEYCAAAEAKTFAPEEFSELFSQRRRWIPSTMANMIDLLWNYDETIKQNPNISRLYMFYLLIIFLSSLLGPSTILLALKSAISAVFGTPQWLAYLITFGPTILFIGVCLRTKTETQLNLAKFLSVLYAFLMLAAFVGTLVTIASEGWYTPSGLFFYILAGTFVTAGFLHPYGFRDLACSVLYFICIPGGFLFLNIFSICNLNNDSWGTREKNKVPMEQTKHFQNGVRKTKADLDIAASVIIEDTLKEVQTFTSKGYFLGSFRWINNMIALKSVKSAYDICEKYIERGNVVKAEYEDLNSMLNTGTRDEEQPLENANGAANNEQLSGLDEKEEHFWKVLIEKRLKPFNKDRQTKKEKREKLAELRDKVTFWFVFLNACWIILIIAMNEVKYIINIKIPTGQPIVIEPFAFTFMVVFAIVLLLQFTGMLMHRYETMLHILSITEKSKIPEYTRVPIEDDQGHNS